MLSSNITCHTTYTVLPFIVVISGFDESALIELRETIGKKCNALSLLCS